MFLIYNKNTFFLIQQMRFMNNQLHIGQHGAYCTLLQSAPRKGGGVLQPPIPYVVLLQSTQLLLKR